MTLFAKWYVFVQCSQRHFTHKYNYVSFISMHLKNLGAVYSKSKGKSCFNKFKWQLELNFYLNGDNISDVA